MRGRMLRWRRSGGGMTVVGRCGAARARWRSGLTVANGGMLAVEEERCGARPAVERSGGAAARWWSGGGAWARAQSRSAAARERKKKRKKLMNG
jgi:hypothetical protein